MDNRPITVGQWLFLLVFLLLFPLTMLLLTGDWL